MGFGGLRAGEATKGLGGDTVQGGWWWGRRPPLPVKGRLPTDRSRVGGGGAGAPPLPAQGPFRLTGPGWVVVGQAPPSLAQGRRPLRPGADTFSQI